MSGVVIDASVLIKLYINEALSSEAERAVEAADTIFAPDLLFPETANVLWKYFRRGELSSADANEILGDILQMPIRVTACQELAEPALRIAIETDRTVYDSTYIALAVQSATTLVTADERLVNSLAVTQYAPYIRLVGTA